MYQQQKHVSSLNTHADTVIRANHLIVHSETVKMFGNST